jgi:predicted metal-dependent TIM-barrel fold hydrolase
MIVARVVPFIDTHTHLHSLPYDAWETLGLVGIAAAIICAGNPAYHRELHERVPDLIDLRRYWDIPIRLAAQAEKKHLFKAFVAIGLPPTCRVQNWRQAIEVLRDYLQKPQVVALDEVGLDPVQYQGMEWTPEDQKAVFTEQVKAAREAGLPVILHTPIPKTRSYPTAGLTIPDAISGIPADRYKRSFLDLDMDIINRIGLDHRRLIIDHADETIIEYVLRETDAYVGTTVGQRKAWRSTDPYFFAHAVERYGSERFMIDSDQGLTSGYDLLAIPRAIHEMRRRGIDEQSIRQVVFDNANEFFNLGLES